jgi:GTP pyrophosphokinase
MVAQAAPYEFNNLCVDLTPEDAARLSCAHEQALRAYGNRQLGTQEPMRDHALGMAHTAAALHLDADTRIVALLFAVYTIEEHPHDQLTSCYGPTVAHLAGSLHRLGRLRPLTRAAAMGLVEFKAQAETLRKMLLAMSEDIRVVLLRLLSRLQTLRWFASVQAADGECKALAAESLEIYAPLANRLGVWQMKWEIEDLSFRFLEPETYKGLAKMIDERRVERETFIAHAVERLQHELRLVGVSDAQVYGRPKHIFSIHNKMRAKGLDFDQVYDVRALRVVVRDIRHCYTALGLVHALWQPIHGEFDDYISHPKGNFYRSLHTAVLCEDGRALEVQIRTEEMHHHAELGIAAHWRYKESGSSGRADDAYDDKISWLRQLLSWRDEIADSTTWVEQFKRAALDDTIYAVTPQGRIIDLPRGATPVDFAYRIHTDLGHRCRGARVDGQLVPLSTVLKNGQQVDIITAKTGGPSRDWLAPGFLVSSRARQKVRTWFAALQESESLAQGRAWLMRELQREGHGQANLDELAKKLGVKSVDTLFLAAARGDIGIHALRTALHGVDVATSVTQNPLSERSPRKNSHREGAIHVEGVGAVMTQFGRCCKPVPPDAISGFVTRGRGISVHRLACSSFLHLKHRHPERIVDVRWDQCSGEVYAADIWVEASDRPGLLRDISDTLTKTQVNVTAAHTQTRGTVAYMTFTVELVNGQALARVCAQLSDLPDVMRVGRK